MELWKTRDGRYMHPSCMTCSHLRNAIAMILRARSGWRLHWLDVLTDEYGRRCVTQEKWVWNTTESRLK